MHSNKILNNYKGFGDGQKKKELWADFIKTISWLWQSNQIRYIVKISTCGVVGYRNSD